jgi:DNA-nicking Smr family endonuclease
MSSDADPSESDEPVVVPIDDRLDLHPFSPRDVRTAVEEYLYQCRDKGLSEVRIIHGRGTGTQRAIVHALLHENPHVLRFSDAPPEAGGWGATTVQLKAKE